MMMICRSLSHIELVYRVFIARVTETMVSDFYLSIGGLIFLLILFYLSVSLHLFWCVQYLNNSVKYVEHKLYIISIS